MEFDKKYFENEIREGFFVPTMVKRGWAAELTVLSEIDRICRKYNLKYFAEWGTLLGAVRHNGFIPWDDDLDIGMKRADYEKFLEVAPYELPEGYAINNYRTKDDFWLFLARVINKNRMCFEDDHLRKFNEFPYIAGVDIFLIDYVSRDEEAEKKRDTLADYAINLADHILEKSIGVAEAIAGLKKIEEIDGTKLKYSAEDIKLWISGADGDAELKKRMNDFHRNMYYYAEDKFKMFSDEEADELTQLFPFGMRDGKYRYPKEYYEDSIRIPFENTTIPVPIGYDAMLKRRYGNYMQIIKKWGGHTYPFFDSQQEELNALLDFELPSYKFDEKEKAYATNSGKGGDAPNEYHSGSLKQLSAEIYNELFETTDPAKAQQLAIELGTLIEEVKGEGHPIVKVLEEYCELIYRMCQGEDVNALIEDVMKQLAGSIEDNILNRREVLFVADKVKYIGKLKKALNEAINVSDTDVYVVAVPYYYKRYDGSLTDMQDEYEEIKAELGDFEGLTILPFEKYSLQLHSPDVTYIQNPFDQWNDGESIHKDFYTEQLKKSSGKLIYISPYTVEDFDKDCYCEYKNLAKFALVPGVVRSDEVYVHSEKMKAVYVEKLSDFAGEETRSLWIEKIRVDERLAALGINADGSLAVEKPRKTILYHVEPCSFVQYKEDMLEKIKRVLGTFSDAENIDVIWHISKEANAVIEKYMPEKYAELLDLEAKFVSGSPSRCFDNRVDARGLVVECDAYFGDGCYLSRLFQLDKKPVMIESVEV